MLESNSFTHLLQNTPPEQNQVQQDITVRQFDFSQMKCDYTNINRMQKSNQFHSSLLVSNYVAKKQENYMIKTTQIRFEDRVIIIQDKYSYSFQECQTQQNENQILDKKSIIDKKKPSSQNIFQSRENTDNVQLKHTRKLQNKKIMRSKKRAQIFQRSEHQQDSRRDTKNIPRNIVRWFQKELQKQKNQKGLRLNSLIHKIGFNNTLIKAIVADLQLIKIFKNFLQQNGHQYLQRAKIRDKSSHLEAISIYLNMIESQLDYESIEKR